MDCECCHSVTYAARSSNVKSRYAASDHKSRPRGGGRGDSQAPGRPPPAPRAPSPLPHRRARELIGGEGSATRPRLAPEQAGAGRAGGRGVGARLGAGGGIKIGAAVLPEHSHAFSRLLQATALTQVSPLHSEFFFIIVTSAKTLVLMTKFGSITR